MRKVRRNLTAEPTCGLGRVLKHHHRPCDPGCEYPDWYEGAVSTEHLPPAPWTFRDDYHEGAPRVCRSNYRWPVVLNDVEVGCIDRMLHLYSHWGLTAKSATIRINNVWHVIYDIATEWNCISEHGFWIEYVSDSNQSVARISRADAQRFGHETTHGNRPVWAVPFDKYEIHRREA